jgi:hypothetical protein
VPWWNAPPTSTSPTRPSSIVSWIPNE